MDWKDIMRGFFGRGGTPGEGRGGQWPPPPPIPEFRGEDAHPPPPTENYFWDRRNRGPVHNGDEEEFEDFGNRFVFGDLFSAMGEMFQEMERSMRDMESFFGNMTLDDHTKMIPFPGQIPSPPAIQDSPQTIPKDDNIRGLVLKEPDTDNERDNSKHYISAPDNANEKIDRDLDDLYNSSKLDLSDLPVPSTSRDISVQQPPPSQHKSLSPFNFGQHGGGGATSSFQKTYQTFSFKNGRWEGEIVKENQNGKEVTRYYQDKDGQRHETTEYFPRDGASSFSSQRPALMDPSAENSINLPPSSNGPTSLFQFLDRFFKPRM